MNRSGDLDTQTRGKGNRRMRAWGTLSGGEGDLERQDIRLGLRKEDIILEGEGCGGPKVNTVI